MSDVQVLAARLAAVRQVIECGYPRVGEPFDECEHGRLRIDDCIGCYDEALLAALESDSDRSAEGSETAKTGSTEGESAGLQGIAPTPSGDPS